MIGFNLFSSFKEGVEIPVILTTQNFTTSATQQIEPMQRALEKLKGVFPLECEVNSSFLRVDETHEQWVNRRMTVQPENSGGVISSVELVIQGPETQFYGQPFYLRGMFTPNNKLFEMDLMPNDLIGFNLRTLNGGESIGWDILTSPKFIIQR